MRLKVFKHHKSDANLLYYLDGLVDNCISDEGNDNKSLCEETDEQDSVSLVDDDSDDDTDYDYEEEKE